ncbi:MAG TPA: hypothetical protein DHW82_07935 [Spirochaetia bacterium]|nr:hypothetical protein [Spirochaetia bacterium]
MNILEKKEAENSLIQWVEKNSKDGYSKKEIYDFLNDIYSEIEEPEKEDLLGNILDRLWGWCSQDRILLPEKKWE